MSRTYRLLGSDRRPYDSAVPGRLGGHARTRIYGRLDCPGALRWLARGHYAAHRVFFADEAAARAAGFRPCAICLPGAYRAWRAEPSRSPRAAISPGRDLPGPRSPRGVISPDARWPGGSTGRRSP